MSYHVVSWPTHTCLGCLTDFHRPGSEIGADYYISTRPKTISESAVRNWKQQPLSDVQIWVEKNRIQFNTTVT